MPLWKIMKWYCIVFVNLLTFFYADDRGLALNAAIPAHDRPGLSIASPARHMWARLAPPWIWILTWMVNPEER